MKLLVEVSLIVDNDEGHGGDNINENEDHVVENNKYPIFDIPWIFACIKHL